MASGGNAANWTTAFGWGNHSAAGYLTGESDPQVGSNTTNRLSFWNGSKLTSSNIYGAAGRIGFNQFSGVNALIHINGVCVGGGI